MSSMNVSIIVVYNAARFGFLMLIIQLMYPVSMSRKAPISSMKHKFWMLTNDAQSIGQFCSSSPTPQYPFPQLQLRGAKAFSGSI